MATQLAINYLAGMTDKAIFRHAIEIGLLSENIITDGKRGSDETVRNKFYNRYNTSVEEPKPEPKGETR